MKKIEIEIGNCTNVNEFLLDYYKQRKLLNPKFSYASWARELSYPHRSNLRMITHGSREVSKSLEKKFSKKIFNSSFEKEIFQYLCELARCKTESQRAPILKKITESKQRKILTLPNTSQLSVLDFIYLQTLLGFSDLKKTTQNLAKLMGQSENYIRKSLNKLTQLGYIENSDAITEDNWKSKYDCVIIPDNKSDKFLTKFHRNSFLKAIQSQKLATTLRHFETLILALSEQELRFFIDDLKQFLDSQFLKYDTDKLSGRELYQIQFAAFPVKVNSKKN